MERQIYITKIQKEIVLTILNKFFSQSQFFVFGSRATGKSIKPFSDLDVEVLSQVQIITDQLAQAADAFTASELPFKVDLIDLNSISTNFKKNIEADFIEIGRD